MEIGVGVIVGIVVILSVIVLWGGIRVRPAPVGHHSLFLHQVPNGEYLKTSEQRDQIGWYITNVQKGGGSYTSGTTLRIESERQLPNWFQMREGTMVNEQWL